MTKISSVSSGSTNGCIKLRKFQTFHLQNAIHQIQFSEAGEPLTVN